MYRDTIHTARYLQETRFPSPLPGRERRKTRTARQAVAGRLAVGTRLSSEDLALVRLIDVST